MFSYVYPFCNVQARLNTSIFSYYHFLMSFLVLIIALGLWNILTYGKLVNETTISTTLPWDPKLSCNKLKHNTIYSNFKWSNSIYTLILTLRLVKKKKSESHKNMAVC